MALSLNAEQKNLSSLFTGEYLFVIPPYQRPYSWEFDQCQKLYDDIIAAYNEKHEYFLGNVILARATTDTQRLYVVDGQQRLTSLWLIFKALSVLQPDIKKLASMLHYDAWDGNDKIIKIDSLIFEADDKDELRQVAEWSRDDYAEAMSQWQFHRRQAVRLSNIKANAIEFYRYLSHFLETEGEEEMHSFVKYLLQSVSLLPIELSAATINEAEDRALNIFETINNRGMNLEDADIFKAKLYSKALTPEAKEEFIAQWRCIKDACRQMHMSIDDLFRYYSHIIRGEEGNIKNEKSLREFFQSSDSVLNRRDYKDIIADLFKIISLLEEYASKKNQPTRLASWLQLIDIYTNNYPRFAVITYLFHYGFADEERLIGVLQKIVRYCYYMGSTTMVKNGIYNIIRQVSQNEEVDDYYQDISHTFFDHLGRLKYGYALLAHYLEQPDAFVTFFTDRLLSSRDQKTLPDDWSRHNLNEHLDDIGNLAIIDHARVSARYGEKSLIYGMTANEELRAFLQTNPVSVTFANLKQRNDSKKKTLVDFFRKPVRRK